MSTNVPAAFADLGLSSAVAQAINDVGYEAPSPIQAAVIPQMLTGRDIFGQAQTGTGKTAAFALPVLSRIDLANPRPQALILTPTRELAIQVAEAFQTYARHMPGFHVLPVYGGQSFGLQLRPLKRGVHVVVGTPGRVADHLRRGTLALDALGTVVLDEADEMLRMGFIDEVEGILALTPAERQLALFSATMPEPVKAIARRHATNAAEIRIEARTRTVETVSQRYWQVSGVHKLDAMTRILETEDFDAMVIFVRTKTATTTLAERLEARGFSAAPLNGDMQQSTREQTIDRLRAGHLDILVATDVAARGLDVERISHVINYDIPYDTEAYVHRIGRTGRAGREGHAIVFVAPRERRMLRSIERATGQPVTQMALPSNQDVADSRTRRFKDQVAAVMVGEDLEHLEAVIGTFEEESGASPRRIAAALAFLAQGKRRLTPEPEPARRHASEHPTESGASTPHRARDHAPRPPRQRPSAGESAGDGGVRVCYRIEVGSEHGVRPGNIVGAIANEAGLDSSAIGPIRIMDSFSLVTLPDGMPKEILAHLKRVWVCSRQLRMRVDDGHPAADRTTGTPDPAGSRRRSPRAAAPHRKGQGKAARDGRDQAPRSGSDQAPRSGADQPPRSGQSTPPRGAQSKPPRKGPGKTARNGPSKPPRSGQSKGPGKARAPRPDAKTTR